MFFFHTIVGNMLYYDDLTDVDSVRPQVGSYKTNQKMPRDPLLWSCLHALKNTFYRKKKCIAAVGV